MLTSTPGTAASTARFHGVLDETRVWLGARTLAEIQSTKNSQLIAGTNLRARWGMNEISGTTVVDSIATAANGNIVNFGAFRTGGAPFDSTPAGAPTGLGATAGNGSVSLAWTANGEPDLAGYNVYRSTTPSVPLVSPLNGGTLVATAAYLDGTAANGTTYYYVVTAVDTGSNQSGASNEVNATPALPPELATGLDLGSAGAYVALGDPAKLDLGVFTIETWFKRTGPGVNGTTGTGGIPDFIPLVTHGGPQADGTNVDANWLLGIKDTGDVLAADFEDMATGLNHPISGTTVITDNVWHHAAATYDGTTWRLYLDGRLDATLGVGAFTPRSDSTQHVGFGIMLNSSWHAGQWIDRPVPGRPRRGPRLERGPQRHPDPLRDPPDALADDGTRGPLGHGRGQRHGGRRLGRPGRQRHDHRHGHVLAGRRAVRDPDGECRPRPGRHAPHQRGVRRHRPRRRSAVAAGRHLDADLGTRHRGRSATRTRRPRPCPSRAAGRGRMSSA